MLQEQTELRNHDTRVHKESSAVVRDAGGGFMLKNLEKSQGLGILPGPEGGNSR